MALSAASVGGALSGVGGVGGMGMQPFSQPNNFTPPINEVPRAPTTSSTSGGGGGGGLTLDNQGVVSREDDKTCVSLELDGNQITAAFCDASGQKAKVLSNSNDGARMDAIVGVSVTGAGLLTQWVDKRTNIERAVALPPGVVVGSQARTSEQVLTGFKKLLGMSLKDAENTSKKDIFGTAKSKLRLEPRKLHAKRATLGILGYESDDESDQIDGGDKVYHGSKLCIELKVNTRAGTTHVLPEELLSLCLVELKQRVAQKLFGKKEVKGYYEPRCMTMIAPCSWSDSQRTAAVTAAALINVDMILVSSGLASLAGGLGSADTVIASYDLNQSSNTCSSDKTAVEISSFIQTSLVAPINGDKVDEEEDDEEEGTLGSLVLVLTAGVDYLEASLVCVRGDATEAMKERSQDQDQAASSQDRKLGWVSSMKVVCGRGESHVDAGLDDVIAHLESVSRNLPEEGAKSSKKLYADLMNSLQRSADHYNLNREVANNIKKDYVNILSDAIKPNMDNLFNCIQKCLHSKKSKQFLKKYDNNISGCMLRGAFFAATGNLSLDLVQQYLSQHVKPLSHARSKLFVLAQESAVKGATLIAAAEKELPHSVFSHSLIASDSLQLAVGLVNYLTSKNKKEKKFDWTADETDVLFERDVNLPFTCSRLVDTKFIQSVGGGHGVLGRNEVNFTLCEQYLHKESGEAKGDASFEENEFHFKRFQPIGDPLSRKNPSTHEKEKGVSVVLKFYLDDSGLVTLRREAFLSEKEDDLIQHSQKSFLMRYLSRIIMAFVILLTVSGFGYSTYQQYQESSKIEFGRHSARVEALTTFYEKHNPDKMDTIEKALEDHRGKETVLWKKLEKKYGISPPRPDYLKYRKSEL